MTIRVDLSREERPKSQFDPLLLVLTVLILSAAVAFYSYGKAVEQQTARFDRQRATIEKEIQQCETAAQAIDQQRQKLQKLDQQFRLVKNLMRDPLKFAHLMTEISLVLPDQVALESLSIDPGPESLSFEATARGPMPLSLVATTLDQLNRSAYFNSSVLQNASRQGDAMDTVRFSLTVHFDPNAAVELPPGSQDSSLKEVTQL